jgi:transcriptional regulator
MYSFSYYKTKEAEEVLGFMKQHSFATVIGCNNDEPVAMQIPLLVEERAEGLFLSGHIMRSTDHHQALAANPNVLCVFTGPHAYISASVYSNPQTASTWNYMTVQARGKLQFVDEEKLLGLLERTTTHYEEGKDTPAAYKNLPADYVVKLSKAIIGFQIQVDSLNHTFKLSQNRDEPSYHSIIQYLTQQNSANAQSIAAEMSIRAHRLFNK